MTNRILIYLRPECEHRRMHSVVNRANDIAERIDTEIGEDKLSFYVPCLPAAIEKCFHEMSCYVSREITDIPIDSTAPAFIADQVETIAADMIDLAERIGEISIDERGCDHAA